MQRSWWSILGLASLIGLNAVFVPPAAGQPPRPAPVKPQARKLQGQIIRKDAGQIVVRTADREDVIVHLRPQARFLHKDRVVQLADVRVGVPIAVEVMSEGDRLFADTVTLVEEAAPPAEETLIEGEIVRVVGEDQVVVRTLERKEVIVFVDPRTTFLLQDRPGRFVDLRPGANIRAHVNFHDGKHMAHRIVVPPRR